MNRYSTLCAIVVLIVSSCKSADSLGEIERKRIISLINVLGKEDEIHLLPQPALAITHAEEELYRFGSRAVPLLIEALKNENPRIRESACLLLGDIGDATAIAYIKEAQKEGRVSAAVSNIALAALGNNDAWERIAAEVHSKKHTISCYGVIWPTSEHWLIISTRRFLNQDFVWGRLIPFFIELVGEEEDGIHFAAFKCIEHYARPSSDVWQEHVDMHQRWQAITECPLPREVLRYELRKWWGQERDKILHRKE